MSRVGVRVWKARQGDVEVTVDVAVIMREVTRIWAAAEVELEVEAQIREVTLSAIAEKPDPSRPSVLNTVPADLASVVNPVIEREGVGWIDLVFTPVFGRLGQAYTPLTFLVAGGRRNDFVPFTGPVAIITSLREQPSGDNRPMSRDTAITAIDGMAYPVGLVEAAVANDAAHEIGHLFGLWHSADHNPALNLKGKSLPNGVHRLMYTTVYNDAGSSRDNARRSARDVPVQEAEKLVLGQAGASFVLLRGEVLEEQERVLARKNIDSLKVWEKKK